MNTFLQLPAERRRLAFQQVDESMGLQASKPSVSRRTSGSSGPSANFFTLPCIGEHLTFKGGTSLSKAWSIFHYPSVFPANAAADFGKHARHAAPNASAERTQNAKYP